MKYTKLISVLTVTTMLPAAFGWNSFGPYTHRKLTRDSIAAISQEDYPDIHRFLSEIKEGSSTEEPKGTGKMR